MMLFQKRQRRNVSTPWLTAPNTQRSATAQHHKFHSRLLPRHFLSFRYPFVLSIAFALFNHSHLTSHTTSRTPKSKRTLDVFNTSVLEQTTPDGTILTTPATRRFYIYMEYLAGSLRILLLLVALLLQAVSTVAYHADSLEGRVVPRSRANPINIPIHTLQARSPADNRTFGASLNALSLASDKQWVTFLGLTGLS